MKRTLTLILCAVIVAMFSCSSFAAIVTYDQFTGEVESVKTVSGEDLSKTEAGGKQKITAYSYYDTTDRRYYYYSENSKSTGYVSSSVCDGEYTRDDVKITFTDGIDVQLYHDGKLLEMSSGMIIDEPGNYLVKDVLSDKTLFDFVVLSKVTGSVYSYELPSSYFLSGCTIDGHTQLVSGSTVDMTKDGEYVISYVNVYDGMKRSLSVRIDHTAPVLDILGVTDGQAHGPVNFGELEDNSSLLVTIEGVEIPAKTEYKDAGTYFVTYTDEAGNSSVYEFTIYAYLDVQAWAAIICVVLIIIAALVYMMYWRKHLPRS